MSQIKCHPFRTSLGLLSSTRLGEGHKEGPSRHTFFTLLLRRIHCPRRLPSSVAVYPGSVARMHWLRGSTNFEGKISSKVVA